ncbi:MAG: molecular chaperone DnaK [Caldilinea sp. CFX5]|nr:molecular chaperone DnaK [Caldilinea sp. CFX5]
MSLGEECFLKYRYIIGIDLGTTNSAVAYVDLQKSPGATGARPIQLFQIPQLVAAGEVARRSMLPSFLYLPGAYDLPPGSTALPWAMDREYAVGEFAREQGALVAGRLVASAKSWLSHSGVDRTAPILPWGAKGDVPKVSPVEASARYLQHMGEAWNAVMAAEEEAARFSEQLIILTVPASFDEVARELTLTAAEQAGIAHAILLEEPLAAFYAWLSTHEADWQEQMHDGQLILVCDVGGGTTDFSIIGVHAGEKGLRFNRLAVGEHLMLGGDNIDITLARHLERQLGGKSGKVEAQHWHQLVAQCRKAKETLLNLPPTADAKVDVTVVGAGSGLIAGTRKATLTGVEADRIILDGFFPEAPLTVMPEQTRRSGLAEFGLPYVQDPAITRHMAAFWQRFQGLLQTETGRTAVYPDFLLFNGGALIPVRIRNRLQGLVQSWFQPVAADNWQPVELDNPNPELAVALGAAYYGLVRLGEGVRVGSGSPRAYFIAVAAEPGQPTHNVDGEPIQTAVCVAPRGAEEGFRLQLREPQFEALTNQPVAFQMFSSSTRLGDQPGEIVQLTAGEISQLPPIRTVLRYGRKGLAQRIPVQLVVHLTEVGTLELWCESQQSNHRWQLRFDVRQPLEAQLTEAENSDDAAVVALISPETVIKAQTLIRKTFQTGEERKQYLPEALRKNLEETLDLPKEEWPLPLLRTLADTFLEVGEQRKLSAEYEMRWYNLLGFCLRPGYGDSLDEWRMKEVWKLQLQGLSFARQIQNRAEWWVFWQRVAGGLNVGQQQQIYQQARPYLPSSKKQKKGKNQFGGHLGAGEELEFWMMLANLEWLTPEVKVELGRELWQKWGKNKPHPKELWALSRFGARTPIYGPLDRLIASAEAAAWVERLLTLNLEPSNSAANALILLARFTDDRSRDIPEELRERVSAWLARRSDAAHLQAMLNNPVTTLDKAEQEWMFGESLPVGLSLFRR